MLIEKNIKTDTMYDYLDDAITAAFESGLFQGLWVQKYSDEGDILWDVSINDSRTGLDCLTQFERAGAECIYQSVSETGDLETERWLVRELTQLIDNRWNENDTIPVMTVTYHDEYDMYGLCATDFY